jgi:hypothetical protein
LDYVHFGQLYSQTHLVTLVGYFALQRRRIDFVSFSSSFCRQLKNNPIVLIFIIPLEKLFQGL